MRLRDDLKVLAHAAPPSPDPDLLLRRADAIKHRRAVMVPAVAVMAVLVLTITYLSRMDGGDPTMTLAFRLEPSPQGMGTIVDQPDPSPMLERVRSILQARAKAAGLEHARTRVQDDLILLDFDAASGERVDLHGLIAPGRIEVRKVFEGTQGHGGALPPSGSPGSEASTLDELIAKVGAGTWARVSALDAVSGEIFRTFAALTPREVRLLPPRVQFYVVTVGCDQLSGDPAGPPPASGAEVTACLNDEKLLMDQAALGGADIAEAMPEEIKRPVGASEYGVRLKFTRAGKAKWTDLTTRLAAKQECVPEFASAQCRLAFVFDGRVLSAPVIFDALTADATVVTGLYTKEEARMVAATLGPRELPPGVRLTAG